tara:strand:+ start:9160 stop:9762 length:603 start_codon:yes stop_codon:yes gene_type:complete
MSEYNNSLQKIKKIKSTFDQDNLNSVFSESIKIVNGSANNINKPATYANNIIKIQDFSTDNLRKSKEGSLFSQLVCRDDISNGINFNVTILNIVDHCRIQVESTYSIPRNLYIIGQLVDDNKKVPQTKIYNTGIIAIQELDNKFQTLESEVKNIHSELQNINLQLQTLITSFNDSLKGNKVAELQGKMTTSSKQLRKMIV